MVNEDLFDRMDARFDQMDRRFDRVDERLDGVDQRLGGVDRRLGDLLERVDRNYTLIETVVRGVAGVERQVDQLRSQMQAGFREQREMLLGFHGGLDRRVTDLERRVDTLEDRR